MMKANAGSGKRGSDNDAGTEAAAGLSAGRRPSSSSSRSSARISASPRAPWPISGFEICAWWRPADGWPNDKAHAAAAGAATLVEGATVYRQRRGRDRRSPLRAGHDRTAAGDGEAGAEPRDGRGARFTRGPWAAERTGVMFGAERSGLDNDAIVLADAILTAPVSPDFASLSLPQAVLLFSYEWLKSQRPEALGRVTAFDGPALEGTAAPDTRPATRAELFGLFDHLETALDRAGFLKPPEKRPSMVRSIRNMFHRMGATDQDVRTWRGIVAALTRR